MKSSITIYDGTVCVSGDLARLGAEISLVRCRLKIDNCRIPPDWVVRHPPTEGCRLTEAHGVQECGGFVVGLQAVGSFYLGPSGQ